MLCTEQVRPHRRMCSHEHRGDTGAVRQLEAATHALPVVVVFGRVEFRAKLPDGQPYRLPPHHAQAHAIPGLQGVLWRRPVHVPDNVASLVDFLLIAVDQSGFRMGREKTRHDVDGVSLEQVVLRQPGEEATLRDSKASVERAGDACIPALPDNAHARIRRRKAVGDRRAGVGARIVNHDDLDRGVRLLETTFDGRGEIPLAAITRNDDRDQWRGLDHGGTPSDERHAASCVRHGGRSMAKCWCNRCAFKTDHAGRSAAAGNSDVAIAMARGRGRVAFQSIDCRMPAANPCQLVWSGLATW